MTELKEHENMLHITPEDLYAAAQLKGRMRLRLDRELCKNMLEDQQLTRRVVPQMFTEMETEQLLQYAMNGLPNKEEPEKIQQEDEQQITEAPKILTEEERLAQESFQLVHCGMPGIFVAISATGLFAKIELEQPEEQTEEAAVKKEYAPPTLENMQRALKQAGVTTGIDEMALRQLAQEPVYGQERLIARGTPAQNGTDGRLQYHFEVQPDLSPKVDEHGRVDYKNLQYAQNVKEGDLLCEVNLPTPGVPGKTVRGTEILAKNGAIVPVVNGKNTLLSGDGTRITAACDGQVSMKNGKIVVSKILCLENVDASTGNILFVGSVTVNGDVRGGYTIRVGGDIKVGGMVENATLVSGGNVVINKGINHGIVTASGSIRARFIESAELTADGDVFADVLLNSKVQTKGMVKLSGNHGCIVGGRCCADNRIDCKDIGNEANIPTEVLLLGESRLKKKQEQMTELRRKYPAAAENIANMMMKLDSSSIPESAKQQPVARLAYFKLAVEQEIIRLDEELAELDKRLRHQSDGLIIVRGAIYPNTTFSLNGVISRNQEIRKFSTVALRQGIVTYGTANGL